MEKSEGTYRSGKNSFVIVDAKVAQLRRSVPAGQTVTATIFKGLKCYHCCIVVGLYFSNCVLAALVADIF